MRALGAADRAARSHAGAARPPEEAGKARDDLRAWRMDTPLDHFKDVRKKFDAAGLSIYAY